MKKELCVKIIGIAVIVLAGLLSIIATIKSKNYNNSVLEITHTASVGISGEKVGKDEVKKTTISKNALIKFNLMGDTVEFRIVEVNDNYIVVESNYEFYDSSIENNSKEYKIKKGEEYQVHHLVPDNSSSFIFYWK